MQNPYWTELDISDKKRGIGDQVDIQLRNARVFYLIKGVMEFTFKCFINLLGGIDFDRFTMNVIIGPYIIHAGNMVLVFMCEEQSIQTVNFMLQHLLSEIGTRIDNHASGTIFDKNGSPETLISGIAALAYRAGTGNNRNPLGSTGA